jgi:hypothetical protein
MFHIKDKYQKSATYVEDLEDLNFFNQIVLHAHFFPTRITPSVIWQKRSSERGRKFNYACAHAKPPWTGMGVWKRFTDLPARARVTLRRGINSQFPIGICLRAVDLGGERYLSDPRLQTPPPPPHPSIYAPRSRFANSSTANGRMFRDCPAIESRPCRLSRVT